MHEEGSALAAASELKLKLTSRKICQIPALVLPETLFLTGRSTPQQRALSKPSCTALAAADGFPATA